MVSWVFGQCTASRVRDRRNPDPALIAHGAKHNAAKRNMIAWRRCVSMLGAKIPSRALSAEVVPRFDAARRYIRKPPLVTEGAGADRLCAVYPRGNGGRGLRISPHDTPPLR